MRRTRIVLTVTLLLALAFGVEMSRSDPMAARQGGPQVAQPPAAEMQVVPGEDPPASVQMLLDNQARHISFQALLTNDQGNPINQPNGQHELDFRLYANAVGGAATGQILNVLVTLDGGIASTQVGPLDPAWFDGTARWLGVTIDNGSELSPRIPLGAVPYAFRVDRVASEELDDDIELGGAGSDGSLAIHSGGLGRIVLHGNGQLMETRDSSGTLVALYGYDAVGGGAASLLATSAGTTGLLLDGSQNGSSGGHIVLYNNSTADALSLSASSSTIHVGSINGGAAAGNIHLYPSSGASSRIHLDGQAADLRLGLTGVSSGNLRAFSSSGGGETIHLNGANGVITATGGLGIGTTNVNQELVVQADDPTVQIRDDTTDNSANAARFELLERSGGNFDGGAFFWWNGASNKLLVGTKLDGADTNVLVIDRATSSVGIGTQTPGDYKLAVNGPVRAKEIVVDTGWSDFVFDPDYDLASLEEVEAHIRAHGHLPDIPSAKEVEAHGVKVGEMESKLLQKIEELTLHMIDMNKRIQSLEQENQRLRGREEK